MVAPLRWGVLGTGHAAALFARGLASTPHAHLAAIGSRTARGARAFADAHGAAAAHEGYASLVADPGVDVVYVATPASLHVEHCLLALAARKPVLCEKPLAPTAAAAREIAAGARAAGLFCMEAMWTLLTPGARALLGLVGRGAAGRILSVDASLGFARPRAPSSRLFDAALGGGALLDLGVYPLALVLALLGRPARVEGEALVGPTGVDEHVSLLLGWEHGAHASITASLRSDLPNECTIHGTDARVRIRAPLYRPERIEVRPHRAAAPTPPGPRRLGELPAARFARALRERLRTRRLVVPVRGNGYGHEAEEVRRCLREGLPESPAAPLDGSIAVLEVADALRARWRTTLDGA